MRNEKLVSERSKKADSIMAEKKWEERMKKLLLRKRIKCSKQQPQ
jgi:hypothetical protein